MRHVIKDQLDNVSRSDDLQNQSELQDLTLRPIGVQPFIRLRRDLYLPSSYIWP
jgi:hypothetical protein